MYAVINSIYQIRIWYTYSNNSVSACLILKLRHLPNFIFKDHFDTFFRLFFAADPFDYFCFLLPAPTFALSL